MVEIPLPKRILLLKQIQRFKAVEDIHACIRAECPDADVLVFDLNLRSLPSVRALSPIGRTGRGEGGGTGFYVRELDRRAVTRGRQGEVWWPLGGRVGG